MKDTLRTMDNQLEQLEKFQFIMAMTLKNKFLKV